MTDTPIARPPPVVAPAKPKPRKPKPGAMFLSLLDEVDASGRRLDEHAVSLIEELHETERLAAKAVDERRTQNQQVRDYIEQVRGVADELRDNGAPPLDDETTHSDEPPGASGSSQEPHS